MADAGDDKAVENPRGDPPVLRFVVRGDSVGKDKIRLDQQFSNARYSLLYTGGNVVGIFNNAAFTPRDDVAKAFENPFSTKALSVTRYISPNDFHSWRSYEAPALPTTCRRMQSVNE